jgi:hypothetical protein
MWENRRKYSAVDIGTLLKLFEISADLIVFDLFPPHDEEHFFSGGSLSVIVADWIRVVDGRIAEQKIYYDPRERESSI